MASSRKQFIEEIVKTGFKKYYPKNDIHKYLNRNYFKMHPFAIGMSPKGSSVDVAVYQLENKSCQHFDKYKDALIYLNLIRKSTDTVFVPTKKTKRRQ